MHKRYSYVLNSEFSKRSLSSGLVKKRTFKIPKFSKIYFKPLHLSYTLIVSLILFSLILYLLWWLYLVVILKRVLLYLEDPMVDTAEQEKSIDMKEPELLCLEGMKEQVAGEVE